MSYPFVTWHWAVLKCDDQFSLWDAPAGNHQMVVVFLLKETFGYPVYKAQLISHRVAYAALLRHIINSLIPKRKRGSGVEGASSFKNFQLLITFQNYPSFPDEDL